MKDLPKTRKEQEVWHACDDLLAIGKTVKEITGEAIAVRLRELRYKAGSTTQRYQYRDTWMTARGISREERVGLEPSEFSDPIARATAVFKEGLERELKKEYETKYQALEEALTEKQLVIDALQQSHDTLEASLKDEKDAFNFLDNRLKAQSVNYRELYEKSIGYRTTISLLENELAHYREQVKTMERHFSNQQKQQSEDFHKTLSIYKKLAEEQVCQVKEANENQRHNLLLDLDKLKTENAQLQKVLSQSQEEKSLLQQELKHIKMSQEKQIAIEEQLIQQKSHFNENIQSLTSSLNEQSQQVEEFLKEQLNINTAQNSLKVTINTIQETLKALEKQINESKVQK